MSDYAMQQDQQDGLKDEEEVFFYWNEVYPAQDRIGWVGPSRLGDDPLVLMLALLFASQDQGPVRREASGSRCPMVSSTRWPAQDQRLNSSKEKAALP